MAFQKLFTHEMDLVDTPVAVTVSHYKCRLNRKIISFLIAIKIYSIAAILPDVVIVGCILEYYNVHRLCHKKFKVYVANTFADCQ